MEGRGLREEGLLRIPGHRAKIEALKKTIEDYFYTSPEVVEEAIQSASSHDLAAVIKYFLRELPDPILTLDYMDAFCQLDSKYFTHGRYYERRHSVRIYS